MTFKIATRRATIDANPAIAYVLIEELQREDDYMIQAMKDYAETMTKKRCSTEVDTTDGSCE